MFEHVCQLLQIKHVTTTVYHPQSLGQCERWHRTLAQYMRSFTESDKDRWDDLIPYALFVYNTTTHTATGYSPHYLLYGCEAEIPTNLKHSPTPVYNYDNYALVLNNNLKRAHEIARTNIIKRKELNKNNYDKTHNNEVNFQIGDFVLIKNEVKNHKYANNYNGPFEITDIPSEHNFTLRMGNKIKTLHKDKLKLI